MAVLITSIGTHYQFTTVVHKRDIISAQMLCCWEYSAVALLLIVGAITVSTSVKGQGHIPIKRSFVNVLDNATIEVLKECEDTKSAFTMFDVH